MLCKKRHAGIRCEQNGASTLAAAPLSKRGTPVAGGLALKAQAQTSSIDRGRTNSVGSTSEPVITVPVSDWITPPSLVAFPSLTRFLD